MRPSNATKSNKYFNLENNQKDLHLDFDLIQTKVAKAERW